LLGEDAALAGHPATATLSTALAPLGHPNLALLLDLLRGIARDVDARDVLKAETTPAGTSHVHSLQTLSNPFIRILALVPGVVEVEAVLEMGLGEVVSER